VGLCIQPTSIRESRDLCSFDSSPGLFAVFHALPRLLTPRHPPHALRSLAALIPPSAPPRRSHRGLTPCPGIADRPGAVAPGYSCPTPAKGPGGVTILFSRARAEIRETAAPTVPAGPQGVTTPEPSRHAERLQLLVTCNSTATGLSKNVRQVEPDSAFHPIHQGTRDCSLVCLLAGSRCPRRFRVGQRLSPSQGRTFLVLPHP
jgi:hypothetical protein